VAIAGRLKGRGQPLHAIGVLLSFDCYLRIGELHGLRRSDIALRGDPRVNDLDNAPLASLRLRHTKTGPNQYVPVENPAVAALLAQVVTITAPGQLLFPAAPAAFRRAFKAACRDLGLSPLYVPHSLRHGGATRDHMRGRSIEDIMERGRWASSKSARRYVQSGRALLCATDVPPRVKQLGAMISGDLARAFTLPQLH
jgi:integrase